MFNHCHFSIAPALLSLILPLENGGALLNVKSIFHYPFAVVLNGDTINDINLINLFLTQFKLYLFIRAWLVSTIPCVVMLDP